MDVLFICRKNAERSQMAEILFNRQSKNSMALSAGTEVKSSELQHPPGRIISELMLNLGYDEVVGKQRKRLTRRMAGNADIIVILLSRREIAASLPKYVRKIKNIVYWDVGYMPGRIYSAYPPPTYLYHARQLFRIEALVEDLVRKIG